MILEIKNYIQLKPIEDSSLYWKTHKINERTMRRCTESGDILLFTCNTIMSRAQRFITGSKYDHVGILLKDNNGRVQLLEATGTIVLIIIYFII